MYLFNHVYLLVSSYWAFLHLKRTPQSLSHDRQKGSDKIQTKDTSKRIDVLSCMISLLKTWTSFLRYYAGSFSATEYSNNRYMNAVCIHGNVLLKTRTAFVYRFRTMIEILVALYYILISLVFLGLHRVGHTIRPCGPITKEF